MLSRSRPILAAGKACRVLLLGAVTIAMVLPRSDVALSQPGPGPVAQVPLFTAIDLHPNRFESSRALGISDGQQVGWGGGPYWEDIHHALLWRGSAASVVDLHPVGFITSEAHGISGGQEVGSGVPPEGSVRESPGLGRLPFPFHALLWSGSAGSVIDLHLTGFTQSYALGVSGGLQVGYGTLGDPGNEPANSHHAMLWRGSAASVVDLNGGYTSSSEAWGIAGDQEVGSGKIAVPAGYARDHALMWHGSPTSVVDLNPIGFFSSHALGTSGQEQVGYGQQDGDCIGPPPTQALLWRGSSSGAVILKGYYLPRVVATFGGEQVGDDGNYPHPHAVLFRGRPDNAVDLHVFLPPGFVSSSATGIDSSGDIVGYAELPSDAPYPPTHAILWKRNVRLPPVPPGGKGAAPQDVTAPKPMFISSDDPVAYILTDPQGRRTGHDPVHDAAFQEIPGAVYRIDSCEQSQTVVLDMRNRMPGRYTLDVFGDGNFTIYVSTWGTSGHWLTRTLVGTAGSGGTSRFIFPGEVTTFATFGASLRINSVSDAFEVNGTFAPGPGGTISPTTQDVSIEIEGHFAATIPAGSFRQIGPVFVFKGVVNGFAIKATLTSTGTDRFTFTIEGAKVTWIEGTKAAPLFWIGRAEAPTPTPSTKIGLAIGNNDGSVSVDAEVVH